MEDFEDLVSDSRAQLTQAVSNYDALQQDFAALDALEARHYASKQGNVPSNEQQPADALQLGSLRDQCLLPHNNSMLQQQHQHQQQQHQPRFLAQFSMGTFIAAHAARAGLQQPHNTLAAPVAAHQQNWTHPAATSGMVFNSCIDLTSQPHASPTAFTHGGP